MLDGSQDSWLAYKCLVHMLKTMNRSLFRANPALEACQRSNAPAAPRFAVAATAWQPGKEELRMSESTTSNSIK